MSGVTDQAADPAKIAAREFVARWSRETGEVLSAVVTDWMLFAYEMGYLRGRGDGTREASTLFDVLAQADRQRSAACAPEGNVEHDDDAE